MNSKIIDQNIAVLLTRLESIDIESVLRQSNIFIPSLVLLALYPAKAHEATTVIAQKLLEYIAANKSANWTWNYWPQTTIPSRHSTYPDDLDDTSCAMAAIAQWEPESINGESMVHMTKTLFMNESKPGGPYFTWIVHGQRNSELQDIDLAVNANISFMLSLFEVKLPELITYIDAKIKTDDFNSAYYHNSLVILYFISRNYLGNEKAALRQSIVDKIVKSIESGVATELDLSLAISSLIRLDAEAEIINDLMSRLISCKSFSPQPLYHERVYGDITHFASSELFTISAVLEAHILFKKNLEPREDRGRETDRREIQGLILERLKTEKKYFSSKMWHIIDEEIERYKNSALWDEITVLPSSLILLGDNTRIAYLCGLYSLLGWISYSIDDHLMDKSTSCTETLGNNSIDLIPISRYLHRLMCDLLYNEIIPIAGLDDQQYIRDYSRKILNTTDNAHYIEAFGRCVSISGKSFCMALPSMLAVRVYLSTTGLEEEDKIKITGVLGGALHHYVCARQISDDAHDWEEDMRGGLRHSRVTSLTKKIRLLSTGNPEHSLRDIFWNQCAKNEALKILDHVRHAKQLALKCHKICPQINTEFLIESITKYQTTAEKLITAVDRTKEFVALYGQIETTTSATTAPCSEENFV